MAMQADRRRINGPAGGTSPIVFAPPPPTTKPLSLTRSRKSDEHRKIFLKTGVVPSASGSAYYEIPPQPSSTSSNTTNLLTTNTSSLKITCTVHGPRPLPRNAAFSPNLFLSTHVKFAPFASRDRRGYVRDASERDLGVHLETALRGAIIAERWPKSAVEVVVTILEGEEDGILDIIPGSGKGGNVEGGWGLMSVLAGCITVAGAALVDAGIDCVDLISGGMAAVGKSQEGKEGEILIDPNPAEQEITAACVVGYLQTRDEVTEIWMKGSAGDKTEELIDDATKAAALSRTVLVEAVKEAVDLNHERLTTTSNAEDANGDVEMAT